MARALRIQYPGAFYHVTSRGNEQKAVFISVREEIGGVHQIISFF